MPIPTPDEANGWWDQFISAMKDPKKRIGAILLVVIIVGFVVFKLFFSNTININSQVVNGDNNHVSKTEIFVENVSMETPERELNEEIKEKLLNYAKTVSSSIVIKSTMGYDESYTFALKIKDYLQDNGYTANVYPAYFETPLIGVAASANEINTIIVGIDK